MIVLKWESRKENYGEDCNKRGLKEELSERPVKKDLDLRRF